MSDIYLRDLRIEVKIEYENDIRKNRPDLIAALENQEDITIGEGFYAKDYKLTN